ncbi:Endoplasmic reticulum-Golgi intermediate compartment protein 3 [Nymphon striatum]|nr:Endoplasmic reticulum-Golgi intermediate compartment protein 3 [Nymphon striatum]
MSSDGILEKVRSFDVYPKTLEDFRVKTFSGAAVSIISAVIIFVLFISELNFYLTPETTEELFVDVSRGEKLSIHIDVTFPQLPCSLLSVDAMDTSGEQHINIKDNVYKRRLNIDGKPIEDAKKEDVGSSTVKSANSSKEILDPNRCESCFGAESEGLKCCNTCNDLKEAYRRKGWAIPDLSSIQQCVREGVQDENAQINKEGCQIFGFVEVNRVGGNFHIAPGRSFTQSHVHVHDIQSASTNKYNTSHYINYLSFGRAIPGKNNPLDDTKQIADKGAVMFQYYVKIVPTKFIRSDNRIIETNQFSVTRHSKQTGTTTGEQGIPGIFFIYEFSPMMVKYSDKQKSFMHFLTGLCAIVGGVFTGE